MVKGEIQVPLKETVEATGEALRRAVLAGLGGLPQPGLPPKAKKKKRRTQRSLRFKLGPQDQAEVLDITHRKLINELFVKKGAKVQKIIEGALEAVIAGLVGLTSNVSVGSRTLGSAKPRRPIDRAPFARFIKSKHGAGEVGLPNPDQELQKLKIALTSAIFVDVKVGRQGPQMRFGFDQQKLLRLTPHPNQSEQGSPSPFTSWLSLVTGPNFAKGGTPGFTLVRIKELRETLRSSQSMRGGGGSKLGSRRVDITENLIRASRTRGNAGELAGIMMKNRARRGGRSPAEAFSGHSEDYVPGGSFEGFWDEWWLQLKIELETWSQKIVTATIKTLLEG